MTPKLLESIKKALERRGPFIEEVARCDTNAYRLFCGEKEGVPGLVVDRYGPIAVIISSEGSFPFEDDELQR